MGFPGSGQGGRPGDTAVTAWRYEFKGAMFPDAYNPFALPSIDGRVGMAGYQERRYGALLRRRGLVFVDGKPLEPVEQQRELALQHLPPVPDFTVPPQPQNGLPPRRRGGPIMQEVGGSPERALLGGRLGNRDSHPPGLRNARRSPHRSHHAQTGLRPRAKRARLHSDQGVDFSSTPATLTPFRSTAWSRLLAAITGSSKTTRIEWANGVGLESAATASGYSRASRSFADHPPQHHSLLRHRRHRRHGNERYAGRRQSHRVVRLGRCRARLGGRRSQIPPRPQPDVSPQRRPPHPPRQRHLAR